MNPPDNLWIGHRPPQGLRHRVATDVGGTFTDVVGFDEVSGESYFGKTLTTPENLVEGIIGGVHKAGTAIEEAHLFLHGTTIGINTIIERSGALTALLITRGFRDIYEIGRINRPDAYNLFFQKHQPLVPRSLRLEINERIDARATEENRAKLRRLEQRAADDGPAQQDELPEADERLFTAATGFLSRRCC